MQQEYIPYGPEWAKEIKKFTKDEIIDRFLRPALMKAKAEPGDAVALPDNKDREEQAEWEFVQILKENYEAAKRSDEYHFAGNTKKEAVVETYEDLFEIIKGLPLKRQKVDFSFVNNNKEQSPNNKPWQKQNVWKYSTSTMACALIPVSR